MPNFPWGKFWGRDALDDPTARTARLSNRHLGIWLKVWWWLLRCEAPDGTPGRGYTTEGEPISDRAWAKMVGERAREWSAFVQRVVDDWSMFGRDENGALFLHDPYKSLPPQDKTRNERAKRYRKKRGVTPLVTRDDNGNNARQPEPEPEPEPEEHKRGVSQEDFGRPAARTNHPAAVTLAQMFLGHKTGGREQPAAVAERFADLLDHYGVTSNELNAEVCRAGRPKSEPSWELVNRMRKDTGHGRPKRKASAALRRLAGESE